MAFNEAFWAATATAAPVLGLAAVVSISEQLKYVDNTMGRTMKAARRLTSKKIQPLEELLQTDAGQEYWKAIADHQLLVGRHLTRAVRMIRIPALNIVAQAALLAASLWALNTKTNPGPPVLWLSVAVLGLVILSARGLLKTVDRYTEGQSNSVWVSAWFRRKGIEISDPKTYSDWPGQGPEGRANPSRSEPRTQTLNDR